MKKEYPQEIKNQMNLWRKGFIPFPENYITFHRQLAENELKNIEKEGHIVHKKYMDSDGWLDGIRFNK